MIIATKNRLRFAYGFLLRKHEGLHFHFLGLIQVLALTGEKRYVAFSYLR